MANIIIFANGLRERIIRETGGFEVLNSFFDVFIGADKMLKPHDWQLNFQDKLESNAKNYHLENINELKDICAINSINKALLVGFGGSKYREYLKILRILSKNNISYYYFDNRIDLNKRLLRFYNKTDIPLKQRLVSIPFRKLYSFAYQKVFGVSSPVKAFLSHKVNLEYLTDDCIHLILHREHHRCLFEEKHVALPFKKYIIYVATTTVRGYTHVERLEMLSIIKKSLKKIEKEYGLPVLVALHPNYVQIEKDTLSKYFTVIDKNTAAYCREAEFILTHHSISINFGYMLSKPVLLAEIKHNSFNNYLTRKWAEIHNLPITTFGSVPFKKINPAIPSSEYAQEIMSTSNADTRTYYNIFKEYIT